jgi:hypothetical protein
MLLEKAGQLVTREELHATLWPAGTLVKYDQGLNAAVNRLREALRDSAEAPRFIETLPKRGYRFIAAIQPDAFLAAPLTPDLSSERGAVETAVAPQANGSGLEGPASDPRRSAGVALERQTTAECDGAGRSCSPLRLALVRSWLSQAQLG